MRADELAALGPWPYVGIVHRNSPGARALDRRAWLTGAAALTALACSDGRDCAYEDTDVNGRQLNPDGVAYPSQGLGADPGDTVPNFAFRGHLDADRSNLSIVSLADYYDPDRKRHRLLHLMAAAMWCPVCSGQTDDMAGTVPSLRDEGLVVVQAIIDGPSRQTAPDRCDMEDWIERRGIGFTVVFDTFAKRIGTVANITGVPWNAMIDTRSMRIVNVIVGAPTSYEAYVRATLADLEV